MSTYIVDLNEGGDLAKRLEKLREVRYKPEALSVLEKKFKSGDRADRDGHSNRGYRVRGCLRRAATEFVAEAKPEVFRKILGEAVSDFAVIVPLFDYAPFKQTVAVTKAQAKKFPDGRLPHDHGLVFLAPSKALGPNYTNLTLTVNRQPAQFEMRDALLAAFCAWDFETAAQMARDYKLNIPAESHGLREIAIFVHTLRGETKRALEVIESLPGSYNVDFPPPRRDLVEGVLRKDVKLIRAAVKAINTRFQTVWTIKTYATPAKIRRLGNISEMMPKIRDHLHWHDWLISHWAVAWLSLARHRGVKGVFDDPSLFTRWIPWELCTDAAKPAVKETAKTAHAPRMTKGRLNEVLFEAIERDDVCGVEDALKQGANIEALTMDKLTPLLVATSKGKVGVLKFLLGRRVNRKATDVKSWDALSLAAASGHAGAVEILIKAGFDPNKTKLTRTPILLAVIAKSSETVAALLRGGANPNQKLKIATETTLSAACKLGEIGLMKLLLDAGADPNLIVAGAPLNWAANLGNMKALQMLLEAKADPNAKDIYGETAMHAAAQADFVEGIKALMTAGGDVQARGFRGTTPLHAAAPGMGAVKAIKILLKYGADPKAVNDDGKTPADVASQAAVKKLLAG